MDEILFVLFLNGTVKRGIFFYIHIVSYLFFFPFLGLRSVYAQTHKVMGIKRLETVSYIIPIATSIKKHSMSVDLIKTVLHILSHDHTLNLCRKKRKKKKKTKTKLANKKILCSRDDN